MNEYLIALIPGDGVGPEVTDEAASVLETAADIYGFRVEFESFDWSCERFVKTGEMMPDDALDELAVSDAIFLGSIGDASKVPDHISLEALLRIRKGFDQYVNLRPIRLYEGVHTPIATADPDTLDIVVIRENTEGEYSGLGGVFKENSADGFALQTAVFTRKGCERVIRYAFELADDRKRLRGRKGLVTNCTKSNALNYSMVFWDQVFTEIASDFPEVDTELALVDAMTMWLVKNPDHFDVVVASNLFGDIITDLGAMLQGGMGFAAGANLNPEREHPSMFEPIHGSAPKYAGQGRVNPVAAIEAARLMLEHLGETEAADGVGEATASVLRNQQVRTADIGGNNSTAEVASAIREEMRVDA